MVVTIKPEIHLYVGHGPLCGYDGDVVSTSPSIFDVTCGDCHDLASQGAAA